jgi:predicted SnoaL-like aldol condensation-catalyzing enzyme
MGNKEIVRKFVDEYQTGGSEAAFEELLDPDVVDHSRPPGIAPGAEGVRQQFEGFRAMLDGFRAEILDQVAEGDKVVTHKVFHGDLERGRSVEIPVVDIVRVAGGRIVEHWNVVDRSGLAAALADAPAAAPTG